MKGKRRGRRKMFSKNGYDLIVTIVEKGNAEDVIEFSKKGGAEGGTILSGRGAGVNDTSKILGILIEPEKEVVLTLIEKSKSEDVLNSIVAGLDLEKPGKGIAFVLDVSKVAGIMH